MQIWIYGTSVKQIQSVIETDVSPSDIVAGTSVCAEDGSAFPHSGLSQAVSAAIRGKIDLLLISQFELLGDKDKAAQTIELFQSYGVSVKSASSCEINSSW